MKHSSLTKFILSCFLCLGTHAFAQMPGSNAPLQTPTIKLEKANGNVGSPTAVTVGDVLGEIQVSGFDGSAFEAAGGIQFKTGNTVSTGDVSSEIHFRTGGANIQNRMTIDNEGQVGIGTEDPVTLLEVVGTWPLSGGGFLGAGQMQVRNSDTSAFSNVAISGHNSLNGNTQLWYLGSNSGTNDNISLNNRQDGNIRFLTNATSRMLLTNVGDLGIGTETPAEKLEVVGAIKIGTTADTNAGTIRYTGTDFEGYDGANWDSFTDELWSQNGSDAYYNTGNVGIGTDTPEGSFHVKDSEQTLAKFERSNASSASGQIIIQGSRNNANNSIAFLDFDDFDNDLNGGTVYSMARIAGGKADNDDSTGYLQFFTSDGALTERMRIDKLGNVGIGTTSPIGNLDVIGNNDSAFMMLAAGTTLTGGDANLFFSEDHDGTYGMKFQYDGGTNQMYLLGKANSTIYGPHLSVDRNTGELGVGTTDVPTGYKMAVAGKLIAEEITVALQANWPDYVFANDYDLMPLEEVENSIETNGHLPGMPSALEVEENGVQVGEMQRMMMEKIEELTLYMIELKKDNKELGTENESLKDRLTRLEIQLTESLSK